MKLHREGMRIIGMSLILFGILNALNLWLLSAWPWLMTAVLFLSSVMLFLVVQFFRLPARTNRSRDNEWVSPCDGKVVVIEEVEEKEFLKERCIQLSVFMSPLNVHCNWTPCAGEVLYAKYHPGTYLVAWHPKSSSENERTTVVIRRHDGARVLVRQIAGAVARRIICYATEGRTLSKNDELGFIRFGSRVDIFLPLGSQVHVNIGDKVKGNETVLASR